MRSGRERERALDPLEARGRRIDGEPSASRQPSTRAADVPRHPRCRARGAAWTWASPPIISVASRHPTIAAGPIETAPRCSRPDPRAPDRAGDGEPRPRAARVRSRGSHHRPPIEREVLRGERSPVATDLRDPSGEGVRPRAARRPPRGARRLRARELEERPRARGSGPGQPAADLLGRRRERGPPVEPADVRPHERRRLVGHPARESRRSSSVRPTSPGPSAWRSAARRSAGSAGAGEDRRRVVELAGGACRERGEDGREEPGVAHEPRRAAASGATTSRVSSSAIRSRETLRTTGSAPGIAARVAGRGRSRAAPRSGRRASAGGRPRRSGRPDRRPRARAARRRSASPSNGSRNSPASGSSASAFMVKSRRARSASRSSWNVTDSGRRPST